jgi:glutamate/tyrosine decarboxylase-like PLP-dependent enzyme
VVATTGTTNTGAIDDLVAIAEICRRYDLWLHVDGAYGGSAIFSDRHRSLRCGIEQADSITIDPGKWMAMPLAAGVILTRHPEMLEQAFAVAAPYMPKATESRGSRQFSHQYPVDAAYELAQTLAHTASPREKSLRGTHRSPTQSGANVR